MNLVYGSICKTIGGPYPNESCKFPFIYGGKQYNGCVDFHGNSNDMWCSTLVDDQNVHIEGMWGYCGQGCSKIKTDITGQHDSHCVLSSLVTILCVYFNSVVQECKIF